MLPSFNLGGCGLPRGARALRSKVELQCHVFNGTARFLLMPVILHWQDFDVHQNLNESFDMCVTVATDMFEIGNRNKKR